MTVNNDIVYLNPQLYASFDDCYWFLSPLGEGRWTWISNRDPLPISMVWNTERDSPFEALHKELRRRPTKAAPMMASACKIVMSAFATQVLNDSYEELAAPFIADMQKSLPTTPTRSTKRSPENSNEGPKKKSRQSSQAGPSNWPSPGRQSSSSQPHRSSSVGQARPSSQSGAREQLELRASSSTKIDSDPFEPKEDLDLLPISQDVLAKYSFEDWWIEQGGRLGTASKRRVASLVRKVASAPTDRFSAIRSKGTSGNLNDGTIRSCNKSDTLSRPTTMLLGSLLS